MPYKLNAISGKLDLVNEEQDLTDYVVGPGSSTDNAIARFDGATGVLLQNSGVLIDDSNGITGITSLSADSLTLTTDLAVSEGGSGRSTATAYGVVCGGTTSTAAHQSVASVGTSGQVLTSNGAGALPTWQAGGAGPVLTLGSVPFSDGSALTQDNANLFWDDTNNRLGVGTNSPLDTVHVVGNMDLVHLAAENDDHALEIDCDAAGFGDVKAIDIVYRTGAVAAAEDEECILINIDETLSTGGEVAAIQVLSTTEGSAQKIGLKAGPGIDIIRHETGSFGNMDSALNNAVDVLSELSSGGAGGVSAFENDNDTMTIGDAASFGALEILLDTGASGSGIAPTWEYSTGIGMWATFSPADGTNGFKSTGIAEWDVTDLTGFATGTGGEYLIRITRTRNGLGTNPIVDTVQISSLTEYKWDLNGDITFKSSDIDASQAYKVGGTAILSDSAGTMTLSNVDALDATTSATIAAAVTPPAVFGGLAASHQVNTTTAFPPVSYRDFGSIEMLVRQFDDTGPEYMQGAFQVPSDLDTSGTVTFDIIGSSVTAASSKNVKFTFDFVQVADDGLLTGAYGSAEVWDDQSVSGTQDDQDIISNTETVSNLGWVAGRMVYYRLYRSAATTTNLSGDYSVISFNIRTPRA
jgi:hypothetical protein